MGWEQEGRIVRSGTVEAAPYGPKRLVAVRAAPERFYRLTGLNNVRLCLLQ